MSTEQTDPPAVPVAAEAVAEPMSRTLRRAGRRGTRVLAVVSLLVAVAATAYALSRWITPSEPEPVAAATADAWAATGALSDALRALRPHVPRAPARAQAHAAAPVLAEARIAVGALELPTSATPRRARVLAALRADRAWVLAVGATLADPRSPRRSDLRPLAVRAATATALITDDLAAARGTVGGTGRLLTATKR